MLPFGMSVPRTSAGMLSTTRGGLQSTCTDAYQHAQRAPLAITPASASCWLQKSHVRWHACSEDDTVGDLKKLVAAQTGTRPDKIRIQKWYTIYKDHITLADYEVADGMGLELYYN